MTAAQQILDRPFIYEVVIGDFGRAAAVDYLQAVTRREREVLAAQLNADGLPFFDEYRRLMFTALGEVGFYKADLVDRVRASSGHLTSEVLVGGGMTPVDSSIVDRMAIAVAQAVGSAAERGYEQIQLALPCNALSDLAVNLRDMITSHDAMASLGRRVPWRLPDPELLGSLNLAVRTVPEAVLRCIGRSGKPSCDLLLLGAKGAIEIYERLSDQFGVRVLSITSAEQSVIDDAVIASIGADPVELGKAKSRLMEELIIPRREDHGDIAVVEACTDFSFGLGLNSLELFAEDLVIQCHGS